jgi:hypothetical protein
MLNLVVHKVTSESQRVKSRAIQKTWEVFPWVVTITAFQYCHFLRNVYLFIYLFIYLWLINHAVSSSDCVYVAMNIWVRVIN